MEDNVRFGSTEVISGNYEANGPMVARKPGQ